MDAEYIMSAQMLLLPYHCKSNDVQVNSLQQVTEYITDNITKGTERASKW